MINQKVAGWLVGDTDVMDNCFMLVSQRVDLNIVRAAWCRRVRLPAGLLIKLNDLQSAAEWCAQHTSLIFHGALCLCVWAQSKFGPADYWFMNAAGALWFQLTSKSLTPPAAINFVPPALLVYLLFIIKLQPLVWEAAWRIMLSRSHSKVFGSNWLPTDFHYSF